MRWRSFATVLKSIQGTSSWILEGVASECRPVMPARALVSPCNGKVPVRLCNLTNSSLTVYKGIRIATLEGISVAACINTANANSTVPVVGFTSVPKEELICECVRRSEDHRIGEQQDLLVQLFFSYQDVLASGTHDVGRIFVYGTHTGEAPPIHQAVRRFPPTKR